MVVIKGLAIIAGSSLMPLAAIGSKQPITLAKITVKKRARHTTKAINGFTLSKSNNLK